MTAREIAAVIEGARFRNEQAMRLQLTSALTTAWHAAAWTRTTERMPSLREVLKRVGRARSTRILQQPEQVTSGIREWAAGLGLKVERHEKPVI